MDSVRLVACSTSDFPELPSLFIFIPFPFCTIFRAVCHIGLSQPVQMHSGFQLNSISSKWKQTDVADSLNKEHFVQTKWFQWAYYPAQCTGHREEPGLDSRHVALELASSWACSLEIHNDYQENHNIFSTTWTTAAGIRTSGSLAELQFSRALWKPLVPEVFHFIS